MKTKICKTCKNEKSIENYNKLKQSNGCYNFYPSCRSCQNLKDKLYRLEKRHERSIYNKKYNDSHKDYLANYRKINKDRIRKQDNLRLSQRKLNEMNQTPDWADLLAIREFYKNCPKGMQVDHIIPLRGKTISGFHVLNNLQYLSPHENKVKSNKFPYYSMDFYKEKGLIP